MRSLSYIIILMSLIANCQSERSSCVSLSFGRICEKKQNKQSYSNPSTYQFKEFNRFFSGNFFKFKQYSNLKYNVLPSEELHAFRIITFERYKELDFLNSVLSIEKKISKIRNKDYLELAV